MNYAFLHLTLNHVPVIGIALVTFILAIAWKRRSDELTRISLLLLVLLTVAGLGAYFTGDPAADVIRTLPEYSREHVHEHEEAADFAIVAIGILGVASAVLLLRSRRHALPRWVTPAAFAASLFTTTILARTAYLGGHIRHTEIRPDATSSGPAGR